MKVKIKEIVEGCMPTRADNGSWYDLYCAEDTIIPQRAVHEMNPDPVMIPLGVAMEIPHGYSALVLPRSSTPGRKAIVMSNSAGVIDSTYNGPDDQWMFPAYGVLARGGFVKKGDRIAQFTIIQNPDIEFVESDLNHNSNRGGFGSSGD